MSELEKDVERLADEAKAEAEKLAGREGPEAEALKDAAEKAEGASAEELEAQAKAVEADVEKDAESDLDSAKRELARAWPLAGVELRDASPAEKPEDSPKKLPGLSGPSA